MSNMEKNKAGQDGERVSENRVATLFMSSKSFIDKVGFEGMSHAFIWCDSRGRAGLVCSLFSSTFQNKWAKLARMEWMWGKRREDLHFRSEQDGPLVYLSNNHMTSGSVIDINSSNCHNKPKRFRYFIVSHFIDKKSEAQGTVRGLEFDPKLLSVHLSATTLCYRRNLSVEMMYSGF